MNLTVGNSYKIILNINNVTLTYTCVVTNIEDHFISFRDKFGKDYMYNKNLILSIEEIKE